MVTCGISVSLTMGFEGVEIVEQCGGVAAELTMFSHVERVTFYANGYVQFDDMYIYPYTYSEQYGYYVITTDMAPDMLVAVNDEGLLSHYIPEGTLSVYIGEIPSSEGMQGLRFEVYEEAIVMYTDMPDGQGGMVEDVLYMVLHNTIADGKLELMGITFTLTEPAEGEEYGTITVEGIPGPDDQPVVESVAGHTFAYEKGYTDDENVDEESLQQSLVANEGATVAFKDDGTYVWEIPYLNTVTEGTYQEADGKVIVTRNTRTTNGEVIEIPEEMQAVEFQFDGSKLSVTSDEMGYSITLVFGLAG